jgi:hypothetical protein
VGDVGDPAKDKLCNGEPGGVTVCSENPSVDEVEEDDYDEEDVEEDVAADVPEEVTKELDEAKEDTDNEPDVDGMTINEESAPGHTSAEMPGMVNQTCHVCGAHASTSDTQNICDAMQGNLCYLPVSSPAFCLPADGDTGSWQCQG